MIISEETRALAAEAESRCAGTFAEIDRVLGEITARLEN